MEGQTARKEVDHVNHRQGADVGTGDRQLPGRGHATSGRESGTFLHYIRRSNGPPLGMTPQVEAALRDR